MLRHTAFFMLKEGNGPEEMRWMQKGSAFMRFTAAGPVAIDFGADLFGGSTHLAETKPWDRTPRWRAATEGPPCDYDVALHLDFEDEAGLEAYNKDDVHHEIAVYNASVCQGELTARIDWWYEGEPLMTPGHVRHTAMFIWKDDVDEAGRERAFAEVKRLGDAAGVERLHAGDERRHAEDRLRLDPRPPPAGRRRGQGARRRRRVPGDDADDRGGDQVRVDGPA